MDAGCGYLLFGIMAFVPIYQKKPAEAPVGLMSVASSPDSARAE
jgi:hypothetical protein